MSSKYPTTVCSTDVFLSPHWFQYHSQELRSRNKESTHQLTNGWRECSIDTKEYHSIIKNGILSFVITLTDIIMLHKPGTEDESLRPYLGVKFLRSSSNKSRMEVAIGWWRMGLAPFGRQEPLLCIIKSKFLFTTRAKLLFLNRFLGTWPSLTHGLDLILRILLLTSLILLEPGEADHMVITWCFMWLFSMFPHCPTVSPL